MAKNVWVWTSIADEMVWSSLSTEEAIPASEGERKRAPETSLTCSHWYVLLAEEEDKEGRAMMRNQAVEGRNAWKAVPGDNKKVPVFYC